LYGPPGSGKTALAACIAQKSGYPFIKFISPDDMVGYSESQKIAEINKALVDSRSSVLSNTMATSRKLKPIAICVSSQIYIPTVWLFI
jgi:SpoVK/Ycf46/Vps4 family AAA+-type ATPase